MFKSMKILLLLALSSLCSGCVSTVISPAFKLQLVNKNDEPLSGVIIKQSWQHEGLESEGHSEIFITDSRGFIDVPKRTISKNIFSRAMYYTLELMLFWHPRISWEPHMHVWVDSELGEADFSYNQYEKKIPKKLVLSKKQPVTTEENHPMEPKVVFPNGSKPKRTEPKRTEPQWTEPCTNK